MWEGGVRHGAGRRARQERRSEVLLVKVVARGAEVRSDQFAQKPRNGRPKRRSDCEEKQLRKHRPVQVAWQIWSTPHRPAAIAIASQSRTDAYRKNGSATVAQPALLVRKPDPRKNLAWQCTTGRLR